LLRKNPVVRITSSSSRGSAAARSAGVGYLPKSSGVTWFTRSSVVCAERMVAARSWNGPAWLRAQSSFADPGYSSASLAAVARARPAGVRGRPRARTAERAGAERAWAVGAIGRTTLPADEPGPGCLVSSLVHRVEVKRQMDAKDIAAVTELLDVAAASDGHRPLGEHQWLDLVQGGRQGFAGLVAWESGHEHPVGYAQVSRGPGSWALEFVIAPHHRKEGTAIAHDLLSGAIDVVRSEGGGHV